MEENKNISNHEDPPLITFALFAYNQEQFIEEAVQGALSQTYSPLVIRLFYSAEFLSAVDVLHWQVLGLLGRIVTWPMCFVILAKGKGRTFVATELAANVIHVALVVYTTRA